MKKTFQPELTANQLQPSFVEVHAIVDTEEDYARPQIISFPCNAAEHASCNTWCATQFQCRAARTTLDFLQLSKPHVTELLLCGTILKAALADCPEHDYFCVGTKRLELILTYPDLTFS